MVVSSNSVKKSKGGRRPPPHITAVFKCGKDLIFIEQMCRSDKTSNVEWKSNFECATRSNLRHATGTARQKLVDGSRRETILGT